MSLKWEKKISLKCKWLNHTVLLCTLSKTPDVFVTTLFFSLIDVNNLG